MSVRMALAKLCACTVGGAIVGGGAVHVAQTQKARSSYTKFVKQAPKKVVRRPRPTTPVRRVVQAATPPTCAPAVVTVASQAAPKFDG